MTAKQAPKGLVQRIHDIFVMIHTPNSRSKTAPTKLMPFRP